MAWLLFMDESGHDHKNTPLEVRGGVAIHSSKIWNFVQDFYSEELRCFGLRLSEYKAEIKGAKLLAPKKSRWITNPVDMNPSQRRKAVRRFLTQSQQEATPEKRDFYAYAVACRLMVHRIFDLLEKYDAKIFACAFPQGVKQPLNYAVKNYLRKDHIYLQERFVNFLKKEEDDSIGILVMDQTEKQYDKRFIRDLHNYYMKTDKGKRRTNWIVPVPLFVDSELSPLIQAADVCIYCINWGYRPRNWDFKGPEREDIVKNFGGRCHKLQFQGEVYSYEEETTFKSTGIIFVKNPYIHKA